MSLSSFFSYSNFFFLLPFHVSQLTASPKWIIRPLDSYTVVQGRNLLIDCQTDGFPVPIHQWKKYRRTQIIPSAGSTSSSSSSSLSQMTGSQLPSSSSSSSSSFHKSNSQVTSASNPSKEFVSIVSGPHVHVLENGSLVIVEADKSDEGEYLCGSSNSIGTLVSSPVNVKVNTPAYFKKNFQLIKTRIGERVLLPCEAFGDEPIKLTWSRDGEILSNSNYSPRNKHIIQESAGGPIGSLVSSRFSRLGIESVDLVDSAFYTCTASNPYGREELSVQLLVQGPPDPPVALKALEITGRRILIEWKHPSDGNSPIIEYTVNYRKNDGNCSTTLLLLLLSTASFACSFAFSFNCSLAPFVFSSHSLTLSLSMALYFLHFREKGAISLTTNNWQPHIFAQFFSSCTFFFFLLLFSL